MTTDRKSLNPRLWPRGKQVEPLVLRRAPLLAAAALYALGITLSRTWHPLALLVPATLLLALLALLAMRYAQRVALVPIAGLWIAAGIWSAQLQPAPPTQQGLLQYADGLSRTVRGHVVRVRPAAPAASTGKDFDPAALQEREPDERLSVDVAVDQIEVVTPDLAWMTPASGGVQASLRGGSTALPQLHCGDIVQMPMRLRKPERYHDPGAWQYADYLLTQGIAAEASVPASRLQRIGTTTATWSCRLLAAQNWAGARVQALVHSTANRALPLPLQLHDADAAMLRAMLFGDRTALTQPLKTDFQRTGSFHLFVVSGLHVALVAGMLFWLARRLRLPPWLATLLTLVVAAGYAVLTGMGAPVQRAVWMTAIFLAARLLSRERSTLQGVGVALLAVLVGSPRSLWESSFQMTFLAVLAIAGVAAPLAEWTVAPYGRAARRLRQVALDVGFAPRLAQLRVMLRLWGEALTAAAGVRLHWMPGLLLQAATWTCGLVLVGTVVELAMVLPMAMYFHRATVFALAANLVSVPLVAVLAPLGVVTFCLALVSAWLAAVPAALLALLLHGVTLLVHRLGHTTVGDLRLPAPPLWVALLAVVAWSVACFTVRRGRRWLAPTLAVLITVAALVLWPRPVRQVPGAMEVTAIDVGQGDSLLTVAPDGHALLVDSGGPVGSVRETADVQRSFDVGEEVVSTYLWQRQIRRLDLVVLSHAHSDHMGGMAAVLRNFRPRELWVGTQPDSVAFRSLLQQAGELGIVVRQVRAGDSQLWHGVQLHVLAPAASYSNPGEPRNNDSVVLRLDYGAASALLAGDAEAPSEATMLAAGVIAPATLLKVGHHGSTTSTTDAFYRAVQPRQAVISVGAGNSFGHPRMEVLERLHDGGTSVVRTDVTGVSTFLLRQDGSLQTLLPQGCGETTWQPGLETCRAGALW
ncbi:MAG: ComEC/Rec2 family competence protein [Acidobacteriota bacterium]|nr:ComEC/Rec2 family competence protein [Acidobacteriota bacterium]